MSSVVMATDYRVNDYARWAEVLAAGRAGLASIGVRHYVVYRAIDDPDRVFVTFGLTTRERLDRVLANPGVLSWYDLAGVDEIPPVFVGTTVEKLSFGDAGTDEGAWPAGAVIVASIVSVPDFDTYRAHVHRSTAQFARAGIRQFWIYRAVDDADEVMALQEIDTLDHARAWLRFPEAQAEFYREAGVGVYPAVFVGVLDAVVAIDE